MMRSATLLIACVHVVESKPVPVANTVQVGARMSMPPKPQQRFAPAASYAFRAPQERFPLEYGHTNAIRTQLRAEAEGASATPAGYVNIYEEPLETCINNDVCTFRSDPNLRHDICAGLPTDGIGVMDDCVSAITFGSALEDTSAAYKLLGQKPLQRVYPYKAKCSALPAGLLDSSYSTDLLKGVALKMRRVTTDGSGKEPGTYTMNTALGNIQWSADTIGFRKTIAHICDVCAQEAPSEEAKTKLATSCASALALIPEKITSPSQLTLGEKDEYSEGVSSVFLLATFAFSAFVGGATTFALFRFRHSGWNTAEEPFLSA